jgi:ribonuclease HI
MATSLMADYRSAMEPDQIERELEIPLVLVGAIQWCHPPPGMYKPNWDAAIDTRNGKLGFGCTVRDIHGTVLAAFCHMVDTVVDPVVAEALAALRTVEFCKNRGFTLIILEGDSLLVVQAINSSGVNWSRYGIIIEDIQNVLQGFQNWKTCHIKWQGNMVAHKLAQVGVQQTITRIWIACIPDCIHQVVVSEIPPSNH